MSGEYVLVPVEITFEMRRAFQQAFIRSGDGPDQIARVWREVLAARPTVGEASGEVLKPGVEVITYTGSDIMKMPGESEHSYMARFKRNRERIDR